MQIPTCTATNFALDDSFRSHLRITRVRPSFGPSCATSFPSCATSILSPSRRIVQTPMRPTAPRQHPARGRAGRHSVSDCGGVTGVFLVNNFSVTVRRSRALWYGRSHPFRVSTNVSIQFRFCQSRVCTGAARWRCGVSRAVKLMHERCVRRPAEKLLCTHRTHYYAVHP